MTDKAVTTTGQTEPSAKPDAMSQMLGFRTVNLKELSDDDKKVLRDTVAPGTTDSELAFFLNVALAQELNPFLREVWSIKYGGKLVIQTARDGYLKIAKRDPTFDRIQSAEVREGDHFTIDLMSGEVEHRVTPKRGIILGAWAVITRKNGTKVAKYITYSEYMKNTDSWRTNPSAMAWKAAETAICKQFANITGIMAEELMGIDNAETNGSPSAQAQQSTLADDLVKKIEECYDFADFTKLREEVAGVAGKLFGSEKEKVFAAAKKKKAELEAAVLPVRADLSGKVVDHKDGDNTNNEAGNLKMEPSVIENAKLEEVSLMKDGTVGVSLSDVKYRQNAPEMPADEFTEWTEGLAKQETLQGVEDCFHAATEKPMSEAQGMQLEEIRQQRKKELAPKGQTKKKTA